MGKRMWVVRAEGGRWFEEFRAKSVVALGWPLVAPYVAAEGKRALMDRLIGAYGYNDASAQIVASQLLRFSTELQIGDEVLTYEPGRRVYLLGEITGKAEHSPSLMNEDMPLVRRVSWIREFRRDLLSTGAKNSLGSALSLFEASPVAAEEVRATAGEKASSGDSVGVPLVEAEDEDLIFLDLEGRAREFIKDRLDKLSWEDMQELVAGILRAMGYKTRVSRNGPDRGKDIVASPDGFGFESPRIVVEVKHRSGAMGSKEVRSFLGGRHKDDRGLYVSTGGFSKDANYEAERASIPLALWDLDDLARALIENYETMDSESRRLVPLRRVYWPA